MNLQKFVASSSAIIALCLLSGCAKYRAKPLKPLTLNALTSDSTHPHAKVLFAAKKFTTADCEKFLGKDVIKKGYQPVHICLTNMSTQALQFNITHVSLPTIPAHIVARAAHDSTTTRVIAWGITGLFIPPFLISAIVDSAWSVEANEQMDIDYEIKAVPSQHLIAPGAQLNGIIFSPTQHSFDRIVITLEDINTHQKIAVEATV